MKILPNTQQEPELQTLEEETDHQAQIPELHHMPGEQVIQGNSELYQKYVLKENSLKCPVGNKLNLLIQKYIYITDNVLSKKL